MLALTFRYDDAIQLSVSFYFFIETFTLISCALEHIHRAINKNNALLLKEHTRNLYTYNLDREHLHYLPHHTHVA